MISIWHHFEGTLNGRMEGMKVELVSVHVYSIKINNIYFLLLSELVFCNIYGGVHERVWNRERFGHLVVLLPFLIVLFL